MRWRAGVARAVVWVGPGRSRRFPAAALLHDLVFAQARLPDPGLPAALDSGPGALAKLPRSTDLRALWPLCPQHADHRSWRDHRQPVVMYAGGLRFRPAARARSERAVHPDADHHDAALSGDYDPN